MGAGRGVLLVQRGQLLRAESIGSSNQRRPQSTMHERHLAVHQAKTHDVGRLVELAQHVEDLVTLRMSPPTPLDRLASDELGNVRQRTTRRLQQHPVLDEYRHHTWHIHAITSLPQFGHDRRAPTIRR